MLKVTSASSLRVKSKIPLELKLEREKIDSSAFEISLV